MGRSRALEVMLIADYYDAYLLHVTADQPRPARRQAWRFSVSSLAHRIAGFRLPGPWCQGAGNAIALAPVETLARLRSLGEEVVHLTPRRIAAAMELGLQPRR